MDKPNVKELLDLATFVQNNKPREPFEPRGEPQVVYVQPFQRLVIQREMTNDIGYGLHREDMLADAGFYGAEEDCKSFAKNLYQALEPNLSIRMLQHIVDEFTRGLAENEADRQRAIARHKELGII